jgi:cobalt-zinc-cadmium resistance protein CzcA
VLLLLLGNLRGGLIVASAIPLSMLVAFSPCAVAGLSGNLMSLGALDFGLIVDGSVVLIENVVRVPGRPQGRPAPAPREGPRRGHEVARPVVFAVGIITIVYLPILALRGVEGKMFQPMALTVVFALAGLARLRPDAHAGAGVLAPDPSVSEREPLLFRWGRDRAYRGSCSAPCAAPAPDGPRRGVLFVVSLAIAPFLGAEFIPRLDEGAIAMQIWRIPSISLERSNQHEPRGRESIVKVPQEVETVVSRTGRPRSRPTPWASRSATPTSSSNPPDAWRFPDKDALLEAIDQRCQAGCPGVMFSYSQPIELRVSELIAGVRSDVGIQVYGDDLAMLKKKADEVVRAVQKVQGAADVKAEQTTGLPVLRVRIDRQAAARLGIHAEEILDVVEAVGGIPAGMVFEGQKRFLLQARFGGETRASLERIRDLRVPAPPAVAGGPRRLVPLSQVADVTLEDGPAQISRENISRRISVEANVRGRDLGSFIAAAQAAVRDEVELPSGWSLDWGGQFENLQSASRRLALLVPLSLLLIFLLLYTTFSSARLAVLIFLNVPLAISGGIAALALRGYPFSISAGVGFIALFGIAVLNGVVLVSYIVERRERGLGADEAAREGALVRLRPVLMTALVASFGFVPMALATSAGAEVQRPLATVVIGGLVTSTLLTLLVLPTVYSWFTARRTEVEI